MTAMQSACGAESQMEIDETKKQTTTMCCVYGRLGCAKSQKKWMQF